MNASFFLKRIFVLIFTFFFLVAAFCSGSAYSQNSDEDAGSRPVIIFGDTRTGHDIHRVICDRILQTKPAAVFHTGDLVWDGKNPAQWETFMGIASGLIAYCPFYPCLGNHERGAARYHELFSLPGNGKWYSVDIDPVHYVVLDNSSPYEKGSEQYAWLENDLRSPRETGYIFVVMHIPPYTTSFHQRECKKLRRQLVPLFEKYGVQAVFSGHNHSYEKSEVNGVWYIVTAGGGAPLYDQKKKQEFSRVYIKTHHFCRIDPTESGIVITAIDTAMNVIDRTEISPLKRD